MQLLLQRNWHISARLEEKGLVAETAYCGTDRELIARLLVDVKYFRVIEAFWEIYRAPGLTVPKRIEIKELHGITAYFGCGGELRRALSFLRDPFATELFSETVTGIIQAEAFLFRERGYPSSKVYEKDWAKNYTGNCRYYSNLERVSRECYEHIGYDERSGNLFNRTKTQVLCYHDGKKTYSINSYLNDSFHGIAIEIFLDRNFIVQEIGGMLLRAQDPVCKESASYLTELTGSNLTTLSRKDIAARLGGGQGCIHLIEIAADGADTLKLYSTEMQTER